MGRPSPWSETTASVDSTLGRPYGLGMWTLGLRLIPVVVCVASPVAIIHWDHRDCSSTSSIAADPQVHMGRNSSSPQQLVSLPHGFTLIPTLLRTIKVGVWVSSGHCAPHRQWRRRSYVVHRRGKPEGRGCTSGSLICVLTVQIRIWVYHFGCMIYTVDLPFNGCDQILGIPL
jgi:hypothetical protein